MAAGIVPRSLRARRDLVVSRVTAALNLLLRMMYVQKYLMGRDEDAVADAPMFLYIIAAEHVTTYTVDAYVEQLRAGSLQPSPVNGDEIIWEKYQRHDGRLPNTGVQR